MSAPQTIVAEVPAPVAEVPIEGGASPAVVAEVRNHFQEVVYETVIPRTVRFAEAPSHGRTIFEHDPSGAGSIAYRALAKELLERQKRGVAFTSGMQ